MPTPRLPTIRSTARARSLTLVAVGCVLAGACTSSPGERADAGATTTTTIAATTTVAPPIVLGLGPNLDLVDAECFAEIPVPTTLPATTLPTTGTSTSASPTPDPPTSGPTVPDTLAVTTTDPKPPTVAIVDCGGTHLGQVYATFCLGSDEESVGTSDEELTAVACPGDEGLDYPGDRTLRRAAARICLQRFEETFRQRYSVSSRIAQEFIPTEGVWNRDDRRVVCLSIEAPPAATTVASATPEG